MTRSPFVYWAQDEKQVFLTVDLKDCVDGDYCINDNIFEFRAVGVGAQGKCDYAFTLGLFAEAEIDKVNDSSASVTFVLKKKTAEWWPYVTKDANRLSWVRVDFNRYKDPDDSSNDDDFEMVDVQKRTPEEEMDILTEKLLKNTDWKRESDVMRQLKSFTKKWRHVLEKYLFIYNMVLFSMYLVLTCLLVSSYVLDGSVFVNTFWSNYVVYIKAVTTLQLIDIMHSVSGFTKGNFRVAVVQIFGRLIMIHIVDDCSEVQSHMSTYVLIVVYFSIEIIRYSYYGFKSISMAPGWLTWLRYTAWVPLYPLGLLLEGVTMYKVIPYLKEGRVYNLSLPYDGKVTFNLGTILALFLATIFPFVALYLLWHMWKQSCEKLRIRLKKLR